ncbi:MAG TPA: hypothetical protein VGS17_02595 [Candidatus Limnocylindria bacterium]|nr:hypothetical protein [Candidatus Limnocylindria bacterium]
MDLTSQIGEAINAWLRGLAAQLLGPALDAAGQLLFQTPAVDAIPQVEQTWALARTVADGLFVVAFCVVGVLVMAAGGYDSRYSAKILVPRVAFAAVLANASLAICGALIQLDNALVTGLLGPAPGPAVLAPLGALIARDGTTAQLVGVAVAVAAAALALLLVAVYVGRGLILVLLACLAPLALACYALPQTDDLARLWWRAFSALLFVQVLQAALVAVAVSLVGATDWLATSALGSGLLLVVVLYLLFRLPFAAYHWALQVPVARSLSLQAAVAAIRGTAV